MGIAHQRAADALARVMEARTGQRYVGVVTSDPKRDRLRAERDAAWRARSGGASPTDGRDAGR